MSSHVAFVGAGAMGSYVGARVARTGADVTLIDPWGEHIDAIKRNGVVYTGTGGEDTVRVNALHMHEAQTLRRRPVDVAFMCMKSYDTEWATMMIRQYLASGGFVVSLQNCINEERIAGVVGWGKTVGCIASTIGVDLERPGYVVRNYKPGGDAYTVFRVGEVHGRITRRVQDVAKMLSAVDSTEVTTDLWGERWSKLTANSMHNGIAAAGGLGHTGIYGQEGPRRIAIRLGGEAVRVGRALGFSVDVIRGIPADFFVQALEGDARALAKIEEKMRGWMTRMTDEGRPSTAQDVLKGRRTEIEFINGMVVEKGAAIGVSTPTQAKVLALMKRVEDGELPPGPENLSGI